MAGIRARILNVPDAEMHLIRRLGRAVVAQWETLDTATQARLLDQATSMHDDHQTVQLRQQIEAFIAKWKGVE